MLNKDNSIFEGVYTLAKFYLSRSPEGKMNCISRTLGKFSIVDRTFEGTINDQDIWVCKIVREIKPRKNIGCFVLKPIERVDPENVKKIIPGFYDAHPFEKVILIVPNTDPHDYWMLSKNTRKIFNKKYYAVVVPIAYKNEVLKQIKYKEEKPEMVINTTEVMQARHIHTKKIVKIVPIKNKFHSHFLDVITGQQYHFNELEPIKIKADQEVENQMIGIAKAGFTVKAEIL